MGFELGFSYPELGWTRWHAMFNKKTIYDSLEMRVVGIHGSFNQSVLVEHEDQNSSGVRLTVQQLSESDC